MTLWVAARERLRQDRLDHSRAGRYPRRAAREQQYEYLRRSWRHLSLFVVVQLPFIAALWLLPGWTRAYLLGGLLASAGWMIALQIVVFSGSATRLVGEQAELWTASELRRLRRGGSHVANGFRLRQYGDIDHVLVGPVGLIVVETKWCSDMDARGFDTRLRQAIEQVRRNAFAVYAMFPNDIPRDSLALVVVMWGPGARHLNRTQVLHDDVVVLRGQDLRSWLGARPSDRLAVEQIARVWKELTRSIEQREARDLEIDGPEPKSLQRWTADVSATVLAASVALLIVLGALAHGVAPGLLAWVATMALGLRAQMHASLAWLANGWLVGSAVGGGVLVGLLPYWAWSAIS